MDNVLGYSPVYGGSSKNWWEYPYAIVTFWIVRARVSKPGTFSQVSLKLGWIDIHKANIR